MSVPSLRILVTMALLCLITAGCNSGTPPANGMLGKPAPALALPDHPLEALRGHVVVLNFWASWCGPCLEEFPSLENLQQQMPGITVLAVSFDDDAGAYHRFLQRHPLTLRTELDTTGRSNEAYGTIHPPESYIVDKNGIVRRRFIGAQDWSNPEIKDFLRSLM